MQKYSSAILISGDLCTRGSIEDYKNCLAFLKKSIPTSFFSSDPFQKLFLVPGNHDIDRERYSDQSILPKFQPQVEGLKKRTFLRCL